MCRFPAAVCLVLWVAACSNGEAATMEKAGVDGASFHSWFRDLQDGADRGDESWQAVHAGSLQALPIARIELHRSQIFWFTTLELAFFDGEHATRHGGVTDWPTGAAGDSTAEVPYHEFARLCWLIESLDLPAESQSWSSRVSHAELRKIVWTTRDGRTIELSDYGEAGPPAVSALAMAIENTARRLEWSAPEPGSTEESPPR